MISGSVASYSRQKAYGFIKGEDGESYFFHINDVAPGNREKVVSGAPVEFDGVPTPKGMAAKKVSLGETYVTYESPGTDVIVSKSNACGRGNETVFSLGVVGVETKDPNEGAELLKRKAKAAGCNAVLNFKRDKRTGTAWSNGNYKYTIHCFSGELALVKHKISVSDPRKAERNEVDLTQEIEAIKAKGKPVSGDSDGWQCLP